MVFKYKTKLNLVIRFFAHDTSTPIDYDTAKLQSHLCILAFVITTGSRLVSLTHIIALGHIGVIILPPLYSYHSGYGHLPITFVRDRVDI